MKASTVIASLTLALGVLPSCETQRQRRGPTPAELAKPLERWQKVVHVRYEGEKVDRNHVGFLCHEYTLRDPDGIVHVYDPSHRSLGFVLSNGKAFRFVEDERGRQIGREVAHTDQVGAIGRVFDLDGNLEFEEVTE